jgi:hypothetical protein
MTAIEGIDLRLSVLDDLIATSDAPLRVPARMRFPPLGPGPRLCVRPLIQ